MSAVSASVLIEPASRAPRVEEVLDVRAVAMD